MRSLTGTKNPELPADPIIVHPEVRKLLLLQKARWVGLTQTHGRTRVWPDQTARLVWPRAAETPPSRAACSAYARSGPQQTLPSLRRCYTL